MNAISPIAVVPVIPETAPFSAEQRAWLNGFFAGLFGGTETNSTPVAAPAEEEDMPWHDPALELEERLALAEGKPQNRRLMAAMAQLDCGQCGYLCQSYAEALAEGREASASLCVPGGKTTTRALKAMLAETPVVANTTAQPAAAPTTEMAPVLFAEKLTRDGSQKDVRHIRLALTQPYQPGDSLSVTAPNDPALVEAVTATLGAPELRETFTTERDIARPNDTTLALLAAHAKNPAEAAALRALADGEEAAEPADADLLDLLEAFPSARPPLTELVAALPRLKPRLYSIASSPRAAPGHVDLCVGVVRTERRGRLRDGVASCHLAHRATAPLPVFIQPSHFRLPERADTPIIMVGPGTGIAPFRAFLQHRALEENCGRNWLFFGDQRSATDFLFREDILEWQQAGVIERLSLAWSRDGVEKTYVQHRMAEEAAELWSWLQAGAYLYVCGDALRMARDVDAALRDIAMTQGAMDAAAAKSWLAGLARANRYQRDVY
jgi:sulfite reductase (NADPH) flavoprotein alpha-component